MSCSVFVPTQSVAPFGGKACGYCGDGEERHPECPACWMAPSDHKYEDCPEHNDGRVREKGAESE